MKHLRWSYFIFGFLVIVAIFTRFYTLGSIPPSLSWDEVSIGYNAYSILRTGRDEHQKLLPYDTFIAYGDYKPPAAIYLTVPAVSFFGLTEFAVRFPSAAAGVLTVVLTFFLVRELFRSSHKQQSRQDTLACVAMGLLAVSSWHIQLSRAGFEANIATFFIVLGVYSVLRARRSSGLFLICWLPFVIAIYTFNSARYFAPLLCVALVIYSWKEIQRSLKKVIVGICIAMLLTLPLVPHLMSPQAKLRFNEVNIFTDASVVETANKRMEVDGNSLLSKLFDNRRIGYFRSYLVHYVENLQPSFLFIRGDGNPKFSIQDVGELYLVELPFLLIGIVALFMHEQSIGFLLLFWLLSAIAPAAVARETPHALRIENSLPTWQLFTAYGAVVSINTLKQRVRPIGYGMFILLMLISYVYFSHFYFSHAAKEFSGEWQYGYREAIQYTSQIKDQYDSIVMTDSIGRPYMYTLFYERTDPRDYWQSVDSSFDVYGFYSVKGFGKYKFVRGNVDEYKSRTLYILDPQSVPVNAHVLKTISRLNGSPVLVIFDI